MSIWKVKAVVQKVISWMPAGHKVNYLFQKHITKGLTLTDDLFADKLIHCRFHYDSFRKYGPEDQEDGFSALELGTGWYPIVPCGLWLCGSANVVSMDLTPLLRKSHVLATYQKFLDWHQSGRLAEYLPHFRPDRIEELAEKLPELQHRSLEEILSAIMLQRWVGDARQTPFTDHSFDLVNSNNTFEHVPDKVLLPILKEFKRLTRQGGIMSHFIDMSDHYAHLDPSITIYNFLQYSNKKWSLIDNSIQPQNRLRLPDFREMYAQLEIPITAENNRPGDPEALAQVQLWERYAAMEPAALAVSHSYLVSGM